MKTKKYYLVKDLEEGTTGIFQAIDHQEALESALAQTGMEDSILSKKKVGVFEFFETEESSFSVQEVKINSWF